VAVVTNYVFWNLSSFVFGDFGLVTTGGDVSFFLPLAVEKKDFMSERSKQ